MGTVKGAVVAAVVLAGLAVAPAAFAAHSCQEVSDIVGHQKCIHYGSLWSTEDAIPITFGIGARYLGFAPTGHVFSGNLGKKPNLTSFEYNGSSLGDAPIGAGGIGFRATGYLLPGVYVGIEYGFAMGRNERASFSAGGASFRSTQKLIDTASFGGGALAGLRLPLGRLSARAEISLGGESVNLFQSVVKGAQASDSVAVAAAAWAIVPRAAVDLWVTPWMTVSGTYGRNLLDHGSQIGSLWLTWHGRSYDGSYFL